MEHEGRQVADAIDSPRGSKGSMSPTRKTAPPSRLPPHAGGAAAIEDYASFETHDAYVSRLRRDHPSKAAFWGMVS
jgi:hypothetical protein